MLNTLGVEKHIFFHNSFYLNSLEKIWKFVKLASNLKNLPMFKIEFLN